MAGVDACKLKFMHTHLAKASGMGKLHAAVGAMLIMLLALSTFTPIHRPVNSPIHASTSLLKPQTICFPKLAYFVAFGPHGPRTPANEPGHSLKVFVGVAALVGTAYAVFELARSQAAPPPRTMTTEYQEQMNEYMRSQNMNPISGVSSEGYKGKGMVQ